MVLITFYWRLYLPEFSYTFPNRGGVTVDVHQPKSHLGFNYKILERGYT
jgi:hypothetical protein